MVEPTPFEKYVCQIGSFPHKLGKEHETYLKPPTRRNVGYFFRKLSKKWPKIWVPIWWIIVVYIPPNLKSKYQKRWAGWKMYLSNMAVLGIYAKLQVGRWCWFDQSELECFDFCYPTTHRGSPVFTNLLWTKWLKKHRQTSPLQSEDRIEIGIIRNGTLRIQE